MAGDNARVAPPGDMSTRRLQEMQHIFNPGHQLKISTISVSDKGVSILNMSVFPRARNNGSSILASGHDLIS